MHDDGNAISSERNEDGTAAAEIDKDSDDDDDDDDNDDTGEKKS